MGNYLAEGLQAGFAAGTEAYHRKKDREQRQEEAMQRKLLAGADRALRRELLEKDIAAGAPLRDAQAANLNATAARTNALTPGEVDEQRARTGQIDASTDRTRTLTPYEAENLQANTRGQHASAMRTETLTPREAAAMDAQTTDARLKADMDRLALEDLRRKAEAGPLATVKQSLGAGREATFSVPLAEAQRQASAANYQSPYADKIAQLDGRIADHSAAIESGDKRTGLFNLRSREDDIAQTTRQRTRLQALEIQDMLRKGLIDEAEADRRAAKLLSFQ